jgi:hypothetical protein
MKSKNINGKNDNTDLVFLRLLNISGWNLLLNGIMSAGTQTQVISRLIPSV